MHYIELLGELSTIYVPDLSLKSKDLSIKRLNKRSNSLSNKKIQYLESLLKEHLCGKIII